MLKVAIITVNYNGKDDTLEFLKSLKELGTRNLELRTIVVDNASSDGSVSEICKQFPLVDILQTGANLGFSGGYNKGIEYAQIWGADYFLLINNDTLIKNENLLEELIKTADSDPKIGIVSPKIYFAPGFEFHKDKYKGSDLGKVIWYAGGKFDWNNVMGVHQGIDEVDNGKFDDIEETEFISGACMLIKKDILEKVAHSTSSGQSIFDDQYFLYFEDQDFQRRVLNSGFKLFYDGSVAIYHKVSRSTGIGSTITDYYHTRNRLILGTKYANFRTKFALIREAIRLLIFGRVAQRKGVIDYFLGKKGGVNLNHLEGGLDWHPKVEYPLKLSIGIVNYNTADLTKKLLQSIFSTYTPGVEEVYTSGFNPKTMEVTVLDNGDVDPSKEKIKEFLPKIKYLRNKDNEGFSKGYNKTIRYSLGEYYLMLNSDIEVMEGGITEIVKAEDGYHGEVVLGGKLVLPDKSNQDSAFHLPTLWGAFTEYFLGNKGAYFMFMPRESKSVRVEGLAMACLLIPKRILQKVGLLDESTFIFFEDIEYARRLKKLEIPVYFIPFARFIHHHGASTQRQGQEKAMEQLIKASKYYHGPIYYFFLSWVLRIGQKLGRVKTPVSRWTKN